MKKVDIITLSLVTVLFAGVTAANIFQPDRPTESVLEQRTLAEAPVFSLESLVDGSYFTGWSSFLSDTFIGRESLVGLSKAMDTMLGVTYSVTGDDQFAVLQAGSANAGEVSEEDDEFFANAFESLLNPVDTGSDTTVEPETETDPPETETEPAPETEPPETETEPAAETETESESETETVPKETKPEETEPTAETEPEETEPMQIVNAVNLSREKLRLTIGSGSVVYATVDTSDGKGAAVSWSISNKKVATIAKNPGGGVDVKGVSEGECILTCTSGSAKATCVVTVSAVNVGSTNNSEEADFISGGMFIYGDAVYTQAYWAEGAAKYYAQTAAYYKSLFGENTNMHVVLAPVSSMVIDSPEITSRIQNQGDITDKLGKLMDPSVNFVDVYTEMYEHRDEYLFFKSDHHWTGRGAYYAYSAFAKSIGLEPTPLDDFNYKVVSDSYHGSLYSWTGDARVKNFVDTIEAWETRKKLTMTVSSINGSTYSYSTCVVPNSTYVTFIAGDNPYTVINVPENPQDKNVLVLKDSFGNAFIPYLCEHFGNIIVVDPRHTDMNVYEQLKDYGLTDIIFVNNMQAAFSTTWSKMYLSAVGVK